MTVSTPEDLADYLRRHEEEYGAFDPTEDGVIEDQPHHGYYLRHQRRLRQVRQSSSRPDAVTALTR